MARNILIGLFWLIATVDSAAAGDICGVVRVGSSIVAGAFVSLHDTARKLGITVVSGDDGRYCLDVAWPGTYTVSAARRGYAAGLPVSVVVAGRDAEQDLQLGTAVDLYTQAPGYAWLAALPNDAMKARFITGCAICHDPGAEAVRRPRDHAAWVATIQQMRESLDIYSVVPNFDNDALAAWLVRHGFGSRAAKIPLPDPGRDATAGIVITTYEVGTQDSWAHDMAIEPATGAAWVGDYPFDTLIRVDPVTGAQQTYTIPVPGGGVHTLHFDHDGMLWMTLQLADKIARFDPRTGSFRIYDGFQQGSLIHSFAYDGAGLIRFDAAGLMWMSEFGTNAIASLDPVTGAVTEYRLGGVSGHTYGIALDSQDRVWYTKYSENVFGMFDPASGAIREREMPRPDSAPHRMTIDDEDQLWIPNSGYGTLVRYAIRTDDLTEYPLPEPDTFPYAARFDGATGAVWVSGNGADSLYRFDPQTQAFTSYRMPLAYAYARMLAFDYRTGDVWTSLSNYPNKHTGRDTATLVRFSGVKPIACLPEPAMR